MKLLIKYSKKEINLNKLKKYKPVKRNCEICGKNKSVIFQNIGKTGNYPGMYGFLPISICDNCGHKYLSPRYPDNFYKEFFKKEYGKSLYKSFNPSKKYLSLQEKRGKSVYSFLSNFLERKNNSNILDHGAATGRALIPWKKQKWNCYGIDPHRPSVKFAKKQKLNVVHGYGEKLPYKSDFFHVIISLGSFEHAYDINKTFKEFYRTIKNEGLLFLRWRSDKFCGSPLEYYNYVTTRYFTKNSLKNLLLKHKFKIQKFVKNKIEGYDTFEYIIAKKDINYKKPVFKLQTSSILNYHTNYYKNYYLKCLKASKLKKKNLNIKKKFINKNKIGLMNIGKAEAINRVFNEMNYYLETLKKYKIQ